MTAAILRELTLEDLGDLGAPKGSTTPPVARLRATHHLLARALASGKRPGEAAALTGYSLSRISILQNDPAFQELVAMYTEEVQAVYFQAHERLAALGLSCSEELQERLEEAPADFSNSQLMQLMDSCLDRTIAPKKGGAPTVQVNVGTGRDLAAEVAKVFQMAQAKVLEQDQGFDQLLLDTGVTDVETTDQPD